MALMTGKIVGYDRDRMVFKFTMLNELETVECEISSAALDELGGGRRTALTDREELYLQHRSEIERLASGIFENSMKIRGTVVRIFAKHIRLKDGKQK
jgi:hypothetical protein